MNQRIRLLAEQAEIDYDLRPEIARAPVWIGTDEELEKFAELIVQECVDICNLTTDRTYLNGIIAGDKIKKHFGVDE